MSRRGLLYVAYVAGFVIFAALLLRTPTLNSDDLQIAEWAPAALKSGWLNAVGTTLFNLDFGKTQVRTYGLARAFQYVQFGWLGSAPAITYFMLLLLHFASGYLVYRLTRRIGRDPLVALFAVVAWVASPAVLPMLKVEHLFLYLIAPYYALMAWLLLALQLRERRLLWIAGVGLLTGAWLLGEGVIAPIFFVVTAMALGAGTVRRTAWLFSQGIASAALLFAYLGFQYWVVRDPTLPQRFNLFSNDYQLLTLARLLVEGGRAIVGLTYWDAELGSTLGGVSALNSWVFAVIGAALLLLGLVASKRSDGMQGVVSRSAVVAVAAMWLSSILVYMFFSVAGVGVFAARYSVAFFALAPLACLMVLSAYAPRVATRRLGAAIAAVSLALSISLLWRAEQLVSRPNRALLHAVSGRAVVLRPDQHFDMDPAMFAATQGVVPITSNGLANPMRSLWTSELALRQGASAVLGSRCHGLKNGRAELYMLGELRGIFPVGRFAVVDSPLTPEQACSQPTVESPLLRPAACGPDEVFECSPWTAEPACGVDALCRDPAPYDRHAPSVVAPRNPADSSGN